MKKIFILIVALLLVSCSVKDTQDVKIVNVSPVPELGSSKVSDRHLKTMKQLLFPENIFR